MLMTILIAVAVIGISFVLLGIRMLLLKNGKFPNTHVSGNPKMKECGVGCAQSQDRNSRDYNKYEAFVASQAVETND